MNASKINASALRIQLRQVQQQIPYASGKTQSQLVARAARLRAALNVSIAR